MDNFKQFNESTFSSRDKVSNTKVIQVDTFTSEIGKIISNEVRNGLTPFYLNDDYEFTEILLDTDKYRDVYPYTIVKYMSGTHRMRGGVTIQSPKEKTRKESLKNKVNPYGNIYLISEEDLKDIQPLLRNVKKLISKLEKQKNMLIDLIGSKLTNTK